MIEAKDIEILEEIAKGIDLTLEITDLHLSHEQWLQLNEIIVKLKTAIKV